MNTTVIHHARLLNPPLKAELVADHLPAEVRQAFLAFADAAAARRLAEEKLRAADPADKHTLQQQVDQAAADADAALAEYSQVGAASTTAIRDAAVSAFVKAVEDTAAGIRGALDALESAGQAAALFVAVRPGRAPVRLDTPAALEAPLRQQLVMLRSSLREVLATLPSEID